MIQPEKKSSPIPRKFVGVRLDADIAEGLQQQAQEMNVSLNELIADIVGNANGVEEVRAERLDRGMTQIDDTTNAIHRQVDRLHALTGLQEHLSRQIEQHDGQKPDDLFDVLFETKRLENWNATAKALAQKYEKLSKKIEALRDRLLEQETAGQLEEHRGGEAK